MSVLKAVVLIDNKAACGLAGEWGLSVYIEYKDKKILLDTGTTGGFAKNAESLGIDLSQVDLGVLSHAHYDHSDGMETFFGLSDNAVFCLREGSAENCYGSRWIFSKYIGIKKGTLSAFADRIRFVSGDYEAFPGVYLIPHKTPGLAAAGKRAGMFRKENGRRVPEDFCHEQSLVFDTPEGLVLFNSCSHGGADVILREIRDTFPDKRIAAIIGGFHLFRSSEEEVRALAERIRRTGVPHVITGHCTGDKAFAVLKKELGDRVEQLYSGYTFEI